MASILLPWVMELGLRHQGVLMSAARGCDVAVRHDPSKLAQRILRAAMFVPHAGRFANPKSYIRIEPDALHVPFGEAVTEGRRTLVRVVAEADYHREETT